MASPTSSPGARPFSPDFSYEDRERWICVYPCYINSKKSLAEGRRIPREKAVENPTYAEIKDICVAGNIVLGVEREFLLAERSMLLHISEMIPKLKGRASGGSSTQTTTQQQPGGQKKKNKKKR